MGVTPQGHARINKSSSQPASWVEYDPTDHRPTTWGVSPHTPLRDQSPEPQSPERQRRGPTPPPETRGRAAVVRAMPVARGRARVLDGYCPRPTTQHAGRGIVILLPPPPTRYSSTPTHSPPDHTPPPPSLPPHTSPPHSSASDNTALLSPCLVNVPRPLSHSSPHGYHHPRPPPPLAVSVAPPLSRSNAPTLPRAPASHSSSRGSRTS